MDIEYLNKSKKKFKVQQLSYLQRKHVKQMTKKKTDKKVAF